MPDWFAQNAPNTGYPDFGNARFNQIAGLFAARGYEPTWQRVTGWGSNIDENYFNKIRASIAALPKGDWTPQAQAAPATAAVGSASGLARSPRPARPSKLSAQGVSSPRPRSAVRSRRGPYVTPRPHLPRRG